MADYKRQHFVPQFYLKGFSSDGKSVMMYNIQRQITIDRVSIKTQCYADYFYGKDGMEQWLSDLERIAAKMIRDVIERGLHAPIESEYSVLLPLFVTVLSQRTLAFQHKLEQMLAGIREDFSKEILSNAVQETLDNMPDAIPEQSVREAFSLAPYISDLALTVLQSSNSSAFITSDNPVVMINPYLANVRPVGSSTGYYCKGLVIYVPIAPTSAILFYDSEVYNISLTTSDAAFVCSVEDVETLNQLMYTNAHQNLYSMEASVLFTNTSAHVRRESPIEVVRGTLIGTSSPVEKDNLLRISKVDVRLNGNLSFLTIREDASQMLIDTSSEGARIPFFRDDERLHNLHAVLKEQEHLSIEDYLSMFKNTVVM